MTKISLVFPGQGSQYVGMGKKLFDNYSIARQVFEEADNTLGFDLKKLCFEGDMEELTKTENAQPAILTASVAAYRVYMEEIGFIPAFTAGHSLGEYSALTCAGAVEFSDALKIVRQRGRFMQEAVALGAGAMAAVNGIGRRIVEEECKNISSEGNLVVISNYNTIEQTVISGHMAAVEVASKKLADLGGRVVPLKVSAPFHSPLMQVAAENLKEELIKYTYNEFKYKVISNVTGKVYTNKDEIIDSLTKQIVHPVRWQDTMEYMCNNGVKTVLELGPKNVLAKMFSRSFKEIEAFSYDEKADAEKFHKTYVEISKDGLSQANFITRAMAIAVCTKNNNWNDEEYTKGVIEPYKKLQRMQEELEKEAKIPTFEEMKETIELLKTIFKTKGTDREEQVERFHQIFNETRTQLLFKDFKL